MHILLLLWLLYKCAIILMIMMCLHVEQFPLSYTYQVSIFRPFSWHTKNIYAYTSLMCYSLWEVVKPLLLHNPLKNPKYALLLFYDNAFLLFSLFLFSLCLSFLLLFRFFPLSVVYFKLYKCYLYSTVISLDTERREKKLHNVSLKKSMKHYTFFWYCGHEKSLFRWMSFIKIFLKVHIILFFFSKRSFFLFANVVVCIKVRGKKDE